MNYIKHKYINIFLLIALVALAILWARSYWKYDSIGFRYRSYTSIGISSAYGRIILGNTYDERGKGTGSTYISSQSAAEFQEIILRSNMLGLQVPDPSAEPAFSYRKSSTRFGGSNWSRTSLSFPHWLLVSLFAMFFLALNRFDQILRNQGEFRGHHT